MFFSRGTSNSCGVITAYLGKTSFVFNKQKTDKAGRVLILDVTLDTNKYILMNLYNANTETEQVKIVEEFQSLLKFFDINQNQWIIFAGDFNIFFNFKTRGQGW